MLTTVLVGLVAFPAGAATFACQTGQQVSGTWPGPTPAPVAVQAGTAFSLVGVAGDHDITFYDANGRLVAASISCGPDQGVVPAAAVTGLVWLWKSVSLGAGCAFESDIAPFSQWLYCDG